MTETRAEPFTPAERAVMAARAEAAEWRAEAERLRKAVARAEQGRSDANESALRRLIEMGVELAETRARLADLARQATAAGPVLEAAIRLDDADSECIAHHVMYPNDEDGEIELMVEYRAARQALTAAVAALRAARAGVGNG